MNILHNKTLRYDGHWEQMKAFKELGLFEEQPIDFKDTKISPREFYHHLLFPKLNQGNNKDICLMRVKTIGEDKGERKTVIIDIEEKLKFTMIDV